MQIRFAALMIACLFAGLFALMGESTTDAATTLPTKMNFQGRITNSAGVTLANGTYNMRFRIWNAASGGTSQWSEDRLVSASQGVTVTNGQFSVQLGSVTSLPASVFASNSLYFEIELPTPASATSTSPSWTEGAMTPRNQIATSAYAYNAETLDGIDSDSFAQLGATNIFGGSATFSGANNASKLLVQTNGAVDLFKADTSTSTVTIGTAANGAIFTSTGVQFTGTARPTRTITLAPEYAGATFQSVSVNFNGSLSSDFCSGSAMQNINTSVCNGTTDEHSYYSWANSGQATAQDYGIFVRYRVPSDYDTGSMINLKFAAKGTTASEVASIAMYKGATACTTITDAITTTNWAEPVVGSPLGSCTVNADDLITFKIVLTATQNQTARAGAITFSYRSKF